MKLVGCGFEARTGPKKYVIDQYHRAFGYPTLSVVDGAAVSANLGVNLSLTIASQGERAAALWPNKGEQDPRPPKECSTNGSTPLRRSILWFRPQLPVPCDCRSSSQVELTCLAGRRLYLYWAYNRPPKLGGRMTSAPTGVLRNVVGVKSCGKSNRYLH